MRAAAGVLQGACPVRGTSSGHATKPRLGAGSGHPTVPLNQLVLARSGARMTAHTAASSASLSNGRRGPEHVWREEDT